MHTLETESQFVGHLSEALAAIEAVGGPCPEVAIVLGSGLGGVVDKIEKPVRIGFADIPGFGQTTAAGHQGELVRGWLGGVPVVVMAGRLHRYGGWSNGQVVFPVEVMQRLGAERLIASNAAGGVRPGLKVGDIVVIEDHIDWMSGSPLARFSPHAEIAQVTDESSPLGSDPFARAPIPIGRGKKVYDEGMIQKALAAARQGGFSATCGTYLAVLGPNYETRAEYRMMRRMGVDVVGMSTVPEVLAAARMGMATLALSMVSNVASPDTAQQANHEEVLAAGQQAEPRMLQIVEAVLRK